MLLPLGAKPDDFGNFIYRIGDAPILWSSHTDTVHSDQGQQKVIYSDGLIRLPNLTQSDCLGADCTTGIWLMIEMIKAEVPGLYIFHRMEEKGGLGSRHIAKTTPSLLNGIQFAVAFDRRGKTSVITHQAGLRCASQEFVDSIVPMLPIQSFSETVVKYEADDGGTFTDTANYTDFISECTNISVGYDHEHSVRETQSIGHLLALRDCMVKFDWTKLVASRDKTKKEYSRFWGYAGEDFWGGYGRYYSAQTQSSFDEASESPLQVTNMLRLIKLYPEEVWDLLVEWGYDAKSLAEDIADRRGISKEDTAYRKGFVIE